MSAIKKWYAARPELSCSGPYIENFFRYRWKNMEGMTFNFSGALPPMPLPYPGIYEGPNLKRDGVPNFRRHISYSAFAHMKELRWLHNPALAQGSMLNFIANQREDGSFPGHIAPPDDSQFVGPHKETFYHANWGNALLELHSLHLSLNFWRKIYDGLVWYALYLKRERDKENSGLLDIVNHFETGQECTPRYTAVDPSAEEALWGKIFRLKGVDVAVYIYELYQALNKISSVLGMEYAGNYWLLEASRAKKRALNLMWDPKEEMFFDVNPATMTRTGVKALTCFYPYFTDIVDKKHLNGLKRHLFNPKEFWTPYPFPTLNLDNPDFSDDGIWKGKKEICPWNGRVWPMANSHIAEAIAKCAIRFDDYELREGFVEFFNKWMRMMCFDNDPSRPNSFEHYHPMNGSPSTKENGFNDVNDYLHSWINDLIIQYVAGFRPQGDGIFIIDPFPFGVDLALCNIKYAGRYITITIKSGVVEISSENFLAKTMVGTPTKLEIE